MAISTPELFAMIKRAQKDDAIVYGLKGVLRCLANERIRLVVSASNAQESGQKMIERRKHTAEVEKISLPNTELGTLCKQPFRVSFLAILKE